MADLTITRRQVLALDFSVTTLIPGATGGNVLYGNSVNVPYPEITAFGGDANDGDTGAPNFPERYSFLYINGLGQEFGAYFDTEVRTFASGTQSALSRDKAQFVISGTNAAEEATRKAYYKTISANYSSVILSDPKNPFDGTVTFPSGYTGISGGGAAFYPVYAISSVADVNAIAAIDAGGSTFRIFTIDGTEYKAFATPTGFFYRPNQFVTLNDGTLNYSLVDADPDVDGNSVYMTKWTAVSTGSAFSQTDYNLVLSDGADDAVFQAANLSTFADYRFIRGNYERFIYVIASSGDGPLTSQTAFVFAKDFSWYDRIDCTSDGALDFGLYFQDIDGNHFLIGTDSGAGVEAFQRIAAADAGGEGGGGDDGEPTDTSTVLRVWGFSLDGHDFYVLRVGPSESLIYDLQTGQWSEWASPAQVKWRAHCGQNWVGMGPTTFARGFGSDVVCGDDVSGTLWILDPTSGLDDKTSTGSDAFTRMVIGGIPATGRTAIKCGAVQLTASLGNPALTGAAVTLRTSDDGGNTYTDHGSLTVVAGDYSQVLEWRALGVITQPGRIFELSDNGAAVRISGLDMR